MVDRLFLGDLSAHTAISKSPGMISFRLFHTLFYAPSAATAANIYLGFILLSNYSPRSSLLF